MLFIVLFDGKKIYSAEILKEKLLFQMRLLSKVHKYIHVHVHLLSWLNKLQVTINKLQVTI